MYKIAVKGHFWAEDAEAQEHFLTCDGSILDAVRLAEEVKTDMEKVGFEDVSYKVYLRDSIVAYC